MPVIGQQIPRASRPAGRRRWTLIGTIAFLLFISFGSLVRFYTDLLWFDELDFTSVFWTTLKARAGLGALAGIASGLFVLVNLELAYRAAPRYSVVPRQATAQYRTLFRANARRFHLAASAAIAVMIGLSMAPAWQRFLLWRNAQPFGTRDAIFRKDISFYVFDIPFQRMVLSLALGVLLLSLMVSAVAHLFNGSIEPSGNGVQVSPVVKLHLSVLLALVALLKAWGYVLAQYELVYSPRGIVDGASYTDVHAQLPALRLLAVIAVVAAVIFFLNVRFRGWLLPAAAIVLWALSAVIIGRAIPWGVQRFTVSPDEERKEARFISNNIKATRAAFELDKISLSNFPANQSLNEQVLASNRATVENLRIWDPDPLLASFQSRQSLRQYYEFHDVDIDRYSIDGRTRQVLVSPREIDPSNDPRAQTWANRHLTYTHGYGLVGAAANSAPNGLPELLVQDLPPQGPPQLTPKQAGIYFGEELQGHVVVRTKNREIDYEGDKGLVRSTYGGKGGIPLSGPLRKLAFSARFGDTNLLISDLITPQSRVMMHRDVLERAQTVAPFLRFDRDPYVVAADDRIHWILDAYTETSRYPNAQHVDLAPLFPQDAGEEGSRPSTRGHFGKVNYMRNSVKVVIDAYDGTMRLYVIDPGDPIIAAYQSAFPDLFTQGSKMPASIRAHLRYPEDLFKVQASQYSLYHETDPGRFYTRDDAWQVASDPSRSDNNTQFPMDPYYVLMTLPGEQEPEFLLMVPFSPLNKRNLNGWVAARSDTRPDGTGYGEIVGFSFPRNVPVDAPVNVAAAIEQDDVVSAQKSLWSRSGSNVLEGNLFVIPIGESLIYVRSMYLRAEKAAIPELERVVVVYGGRVGFGKTLQESLNQVITGAPPPPVEDPGQEQPPEGQPSPPPAPSGDVAGLLRQAVDHHRAADEALKRGDLSTYQRENEAARRAVEEASRRQGGDG
ncbi:MAG TPA: UPF0182 family protein [Actinomycetota bacterium]|nr:UPF0182 family protein [Actinomycetota bacterium]